MAEPRVPAPPWPDAAARRRLAADRDRLLVRLEALRASNDWTPAHKAVRELRSGSQREALRRAVLGAPSPEVARQRLETLADRRLFKGLKESIRWLQTIDAGLIQVVVDELVEEARARDVGLVPGEPDRPKAASSSAGGQAPPREEVEGLEA
jgi:hypothetical protein